MGQARDKLGTSARLYLANVTLFCDTTSNDEDILPKYKEFTNKPRCPWRGSRIPYLSARRPGRTPVFVRICVHPSLEQDAVEQGEPHEEAAQVLRPR